MTTTAIQSGTWQRWQPTSAEPWNVRRVVHLHRRAGFAATWQEFQRDLKDGHEASIRRVLTGKGRLDGLPEDFDRTAALLANSAIASGDAARLKAWWVYRMLAGPDPLGERLVLLWHNHFATSNSKVQDLAAMRRQNEIFREFARAPFGDLLPRAVKDPAMIVWLDAQSNRKEHPNENLAREIMELFSLGVGNYSEEDIKQASRALTGWSAKGGEFRSYAQFHDDDNKTIFGQTGKWSGDDLVRMLLDHPATPRRLAFRICELFMGEGAVDSDDIDALAVGIRDHSLDVGWAVETVLHSQAFFSDRNLGNRILSPIEFVVGAVRALEMFDPSPSTLILCEWAAKLGQDLFYPPNVFGWSGGRSWITSRSVIARANFAAALTEGLLSSPAAPADHLGLARKYGVAQNLEDTVDFFSKLLLGRPLKPDWLDRWTKHARAKPAFDSATVGNAIAAILSSPESQLA